MTDAVQMAVFPHEIRDSLERIKDLSDRLYEAMPDRNRPSEVSAASVASSVVNSFSAFPDGMPVEEMVSRSISISMIIGAQAILLARILSNFSKSDQSERERLIADAFLSAYGIDDFHMERTGAEIEGRDELAGAVIQFSALAVHVLREAHRTKRETVN